MEQAETQNTPKRLVVGILAHAAGLIPEPTPISPCDLLPLFTWEKVPRKDLVLRMEQ